MSLVDLVTAKILGVPRRAPYIRTRKVEDLILDGTAGLCRNFGAKGDGVTNDYQAFVDWWACLMDVTYKRNAAAAGEPAFMLQKGPCLNIENGQYLFDGPSLNIAVGDAFVLDVRGESALSTKIINPNDTYLFDLDNNPVVSNLTDLTVYGGLGIIRYKSTARNASGKHYLARLRASRFKECAISTNSIDMPYFIVEDCTFYGSTSNQTIGVAITGLTAGGGVYRSIFSDVMYGIKLGVSSRNGETNGPATPFTVRGNDFYRTGNISTPSYDIWFVPGLTATNSGRGILVLDNKFGQEHLRSPDSHILVAAENISAATGAGLSGDVPHSSSVTSGFLSGVTFSNNNVNSVRGSYAAPFMRSFTPNVGNNSFADLYDNGMPSAIINFEAGINASSYTNILGTNSIYFNQCLPLQKGEVPQPLSNLHGVFSVTDPNGWYQGHPQGYSTRGAQAAGAVTVYSPADTSALPLTAATSVSTTNSYGAPGEAATITLTSADGRITKSVSLSAQTPVVLDLDLRRGATNPAPAVAVEVYLGNTLMFRRPVYLGTSDAHGARKWRKVAWEFTPPVDGTYIVRVRGMAYSASTSTFDVGNFIVYDNTYGVLNTGHNSVFGNNSWSRQHQVIGTQHMWRDGSGNLRAKLSAPASATDGVIVSANVVTS